jgi:hypothetical protein
MIQLVCAYAIACQQDIHILFLGNSHTVVNDLTGMVKSLLESDGSGRHVKVKVESAALLNDFANRPEVRDEITNGKWDDIVLQGASMSSSHQYVYSQAGGIEIARLAVASGARTLLFAEWPRRGWNETDYILAIYDGIAKASGATVVPIPRCWDVALQYQRNPDLWNADGNHSSPDGAYLAACGFYYWMTASKSAPTYVPSFLSVKAATQLRSYAQIAMRR